MQLTDTSLEVRKYPAEVGNRLGSIQRPFERELFKFLEVEHAPTMNYLGRIEANLLAREVAVEQQLLNPPLDAPRAG